MPRLFAVRVFRLVHNSTTTVSRHTGWPKKVSHYQMIIKSYYPIKVCQWDWIYSSNWSINQAL